MHVKDSRPSVRLGLDIYIIYVCLTAVVCAYSCSVNSDNMFGWPLGIGITCVLDNFQFYSRSNLEGGLA